MQNPALMFAKWRFRRLPKPEGLIHAEVAVAFPDQTDDTLATCDAYFLQGIRSGVLGALSQIPQREERYRQAMPQIVAALCAALKRRGVDGAAVVVPPSSRNDARPYADALLRQGIAAIDLSDRIERVDSSFRAGGAENLQTVRSSLRVVGRPDFATARILVVVDDILSSGRSIAATVLGLRDARFIDRETRVVGCAVLEVVPAGTSTGAS